MSTAFVQAMEDPDLSSAYERIVDWATDPSDPPHSTIADAHALLVSRYEDGDHLAEAVIRELEDDSIGWQNCSSGCPSYSPLRLLGHECPDGVSWRSPSRVRAAQEALNHCLPYLGRLVAQDQFGLRPPPCDVCGANPPYTFCSCGQIDRVYSLHRD